MLRRQTGDRRTASIMGKVMGELRALLKGQSFASLEEANAFIGQHLQNL